MRAIDIISAKRDGQALSRQAIQWFIQEYTQGVIPDYQAAAFLMAVYLRGMTRQETVDLTMALVESGDQLDLSDITDYAVDKHSSGGVGDKTSLVVLPLVASMGVAVAKMSGRGLGFTGGTLDKMESIRGYNVNLTPEQFRAQAKTLGLVLAGQTGVLAPADGKLYALRDVTATVSSLPLIASSIMSKKIAAGAKGIVLDVKMGAGAFMRDLESARQLAQMMVEIGADSGRDVVAMISDMNQPLGEAVGNALELQEAIETLHGQGPEDFRLHCLEVAKYMLILAGRGKQWTDEAAVYEQLNAQLHNGEAFGKFRAMVAAQGGDVQQIDDPSLLPQAAVTHVLLAERAGYVSQLSADLIGMAAMRLGAGRERKEDAINHAVGLKLHVKVGDAVTPSTPVVTLYANSDEQAASVADDLRLALDYSDSPTAKLPLFYDVIRNGSVGR
ncbi:MAG: thymidine phosphorylase [Phototrophicaceae bacterium]